MMYTYEPSMIQLRRDLEKFYESALKQKKEIKAEKEN